MRPRTLQMCVTPHPANVGDIASSKCGNHRALQMCEPPHPKCRDACNASASNEGNILTQHTRSPAHPAAPLRGPRSLHGQDNSQDADALHASLHCGCVGMRNCSAIRFTTEKTRIRSVHNVFTESIANDGVHKNFLP